ncbi:RNA polymerase II transcription factor B subunit 4 [Toensbergia leucococca]|nr:RNA polymerase II transcription factor B subunit 4 [Toensbergia leucococca]
MNAVDASEHYTTTSDGIYPLLNPSPQKLIQHSINNLTLEPPATLLTIIVDTNPHAWALLSPTLPLSKALANLLVFINAHLAFNYANKIALIASHTQRAEFLYPSSKYHATNGTSLAHYLRANGSDTETRDHGPPPPSSDDANHYRPFRLIQATLLKSLHALFSSTSPKTLTSNPTTSISGALSLALSYITKQTPSSTSITTTNPLPTHNDQAAPTLQSRILVLSVSGDLAHQYIPLMNCIFAAQNLSIPIDICKIAGDTVFLQQASDATRGTYIKLEHPQGLLQYLMMGFLPDQTSRQYLISPTQVGVDFRAACFCHRRVVDTGFVCSICLSIFCSPPEGAICLTCGTELELKDYGGKPVVVSTKKKKRKNRVDGERRPGTNFGTPEP